MSSYEYYFYKNLASLPRKDPAIPKFQNGEIVNHVTIFGLVPCKVIGTDIVRNRYTVKFFDGRLEDMHENDLLKDIHQKKEERMIKYESKIDALERIYNYLFGDRLEPSPEERIKIKFKLEKVIELLRDLNRKESIKKEKPKLKVGDTVEILGNTVVIEDVVDAGRLAHCICLDGEGRFQRLNISYDFLMTMKGWKI